MTKLSDRMIRADVFADGRLLRVSPEARLLATVLEALAESTGMIRRDSAEIRGAAGFYLAGRDGLPPTAEAIDALCDELVSARWALDYVCQGMRLLYLQGFGKRQKGPNVCIGVEQANGVVASHLPMPACVELEPHYERLRNTGETTVRKHLPKHCPNDYTRCPCEWYPNGSPTLHELGEKTEGKGIERNTSEGRGMDLDLSTNRNDLSAREGISGRGQQCGFCDGTGRIGYFACPSCGDQGAK